MQFITNGPNIPEELLQAHEEGNVVFFCGAGISYPAGLPGFKGLVEDIYDICGTKLSDIEKEAFSRNQFDATLDLLEHRLPGQRLAVRRALECALKPNLRKKGSTDTHNALLTLGKNRDGVLRLVTTNFDRVFHQVAKRNKDPFVTYSAPMLPIPKKSRWNGLVYLHGLLSEKSDDINLNRLVVTSGDFGLAYLIERWAARFVSELFRNYVVCFIGYSINDPVLRYMMDALAADRLLGEVTPQAWALGDCEPGQEESKTIEWESKGVTPILYEVPKNSYDHSGLHRTLKAWAETYRDGITGKERIVVNHALARPSSSTKQDDFVGRMLWALSDKSGLPAKRFAEFKPTPPLEWLLRAFNDERFRHNDLNRFGISPNNEINLKLQFSYIRRPSPYLLSPQMMLTSNLNSNRGWDDIMFNIARWLLNYLDSPDLVIWIAQNGGALNKQWQRMIESELERFDELERDKKFSEIDEIRSYAPQAVPRPAMRTLWKMILGDWLKIPWYVTDIYSWMRDLNRGGLTTPLRLALRKILAPRLVIRAPYHWENEVPNSSSEVRISDLVSWELSLAGDHVYSSLEEFSGAAWEDALPSLVDEFQILVRDALDLIAEMGEADSKNDRSFWDLPSITPHKQNKRFKEWVVLIELLRDSWIALNRENRNRASQIVRSWIEIPYPTFKRLAFFAASQDGNIDSKEWVNWLLTDDAWWLWSLETQREVLRLFVLKGRFLNGGVQNLLEEAILIGPPRKMFRDDLEISRWENLVARSVWLHLSKLKSSGLVLGEKATKKLLELSILFPQWKLAENERDEFSHWTSGTGDPEFEEERERSKVHAPIKREKLVSWLREMPASDRRSLHEDTWRDVCEKHLLNSLYALCDLSADDEWPSERWREALQVWSNEKYVSRSWRYASPLVQRMPDGKLLELAHQVSWWMSSASKSISQHEEIMLDLCRRVISLPIEQDTGMTINGKPANRPVTEAINHPVGHITQALFNLWFRSDPSDGDKIDPNISDIFSHFCNTDIDRFRHARVLLGSRLISLFRVDRVWTEENLLPIFRWENPIEARAVWVGFLWSPRLYQPLLTEFKKDFLETARHYDELDEHAEQYAAILTYAALGPTDGYSAEDWRSAFAVLPQSGLEKAAQALAQALEGAGKQKRSYWENRVRPFWLHVWPKSRELASSQIAQSLARLLAASEEAFPDALDVFEAWLQPIDHWDFVVRRLREAGLCNQFPEQALRYLSLLINDPQWVSRELKTCLDAIKLAKPSLERDRDYLRLFEYCRRHGV